MLVANGVEHDSRVIREARCLADDGRDVVVLGAAPEAREWRHDSGFTVQVAAVPPRERWPQRTRLTRRERPIELVRLDVYRDAWAPLVRELRPRVLHVHDLHGLALAGAAPHTVFDAHEDPLARRFKRPGEREQVRRELAALVGRADAVITVSAPLAERLSGELALSRPPVLVHNTPSLQTSEPPARLRDVVGLDERTPLLVYSGGFTTRRRLTVVLEALRLVPGAHLALVVGSGDPRLDALLERASELGVADRVHPAPFVPPEAVVPYVAGADVGVHPLDRYANADIALPNKLFEYLHAGLPMVMSDPPAMASFVREHDLGFVASTEDAEAWAAGIRGALALPRLSERPGWRELTREWSWESQAERLLELYRSLP